MYRNLHSSCKTTSVCRFKPFLSDHFERGFGNKQIRTDSKQVPKVKLPVRFN